MKLKIVKLFHHVIKLCQTISAGDDHFIAVFVEGEGIDGPLLH